MASIRYVGHATTLIELDGVRLLTDPLLRRHVGHLQRLVPLGEDLPPPDAVLLSHQHADHLDLASLRRLGQSMLLLVPRGAGWTLKRQGFRRVVELSPGDSTSVGELAIAAVPAVHDGRRYPYGKKVAALGYAVTGSRSVYFAGDTDVFDGMSELAGADVSLIPVSGWGAKVGPGHLDPARAADCSPAQAARGDPDPLGDVRPLALASTGEVAVRGSCGGVRGGRGHRRPRGGGAHPPAGRANGLLSLRLRLFVRHDPGDERDRD